MTGFPAIVLHGVSKRYGRDVTALSDVTLRVEVGEFVSIIGPSAAGKTTLLHLIAGLDAASSGRIVVAGRDLSALSDDARSDLRLRTIGLVFQAFNLFPTFTAEENVAWPVRFLGLGRREAHERAAALLERLGIDPSARTRLPAELSSGEQQRVAIARALVNRPRLVLADEPTGNLDSRTGHEILRILSELAERQVTIVLVTHDPLAASLADRTLELQDGRIVRHVPRLARRWRPATIPR
jgi:putative ABC transport system ATP-binding protein